MLENEEKCFLCGQQVPNGIKSRESHYCPCCGNVNITNTAYLDIPELKGKRHLLSGLFREWTEKGVKTKPLTSYELKTVLQKAEIPKTIPDKVDKLLVYLGMKSETFGQKVKLCPEKDYSLTYSPSHQELDSILQYLNQQGMVTYPGARTLDKPHMVELTMAGWERFYKLEKQTIDSKMCFVAMNFDPEFDGIYDMIFKAADSCGFRAYRVKEEQTNDDITDLIIGKIRKCGFVIADFTGQKAGVYFEAGFAKGLDKEVIWLCRSDDIKNVHFDTNHYSHICWDNEIDLEKKLVNRILATIPSADTRRT